MTSQEYAVQTLACNTLIAITNGLRDLPQYTAEIAEMQRDMYAVQAPQAKLCMYILRDIKAMYEGQYMSQDYDNLETWQ